MTTVVIVIDRTLLLQRFEAAILQGIASLTAAVRAANPEIQVRVAGYGRHPDFNYVDPGSQALRQLCIFDGPRGHFFFGATRAISALTCAGADNRVFVLSILSTHTFTGDPVSLGDFTAAHQTARAQQLWRFGIMGIGISVYSRLDLFGFQPYFALNVATRDDAITKAFAIYATRVIALSQAAETKLYGSALTLTVESRKQVAPLVDSDWHYADYVIPVPAALDWDLFEAALARHTWSNGYSDDAAVHRHEAASDRRIEGLHSAFRRVDPLRADALFAKYSGSATP